MSKFPLIETAEQRGRVFREEGRSETHSGEAMSQTEEQRCGDCGDTLARSKKLRAPGCLHCEHVAKLAAEAQLASLTEEIAHLKEQLKKGGAFCSFCGWTHEYDPDEEGAQSFAATMLAAHVRNCKKHPLIKRAEAAEEALQVSEQFRAEERRQLDAERRLRLEDGTKVIDAMVVMDGLKRQLASIQAENETLKKERDEAVRDAQ